MPDFTDDMFRPANIEGAYNVDDKAPDRARRDLAAVSRHNDQAIPPSVPPRGTPPTQGIDVAKPSLVPGPNYPSGPGGFAMNPNVAPPGVEGPEDLEE